MSGDPDVYTHLQALKKPQNHFFLFNFQLKHTHSCLNKVHILKPNTGKQQNTDFELLIVFVTVSLDPL